MTSGFAAQPESEPARFERSLLTSREAKSLLRSASTGTPGGATALMADRSRAEARNHHRLSWDPLFQDLVAQVNREEDIADSLDWDAVADMETVQDVLMYKTNLASDKFRCGAVCVLDCAITLPSICCMSTRCSSLMCLGHLHTHNVLIM